MNRLRTIFACLLALLMLSPGLAFSDKAGTVMSGVGGAQSATGLAGSPDICWKSSYGRGVAGIPTACGPNEENQAGLCYPKCQPGHKGVGVVCWQECPAGYRDDGVTCAKPGSIITRGAYTIGKEYTGANRYKKTAWPHECDNGTTFDTVDGGGCWRCPSGFERSEKHIAQGEGCSRWGGNSECTKWARENFGTDRCEKIGALLYPVPPDGTSCTLNSCMKNCPNGFRDDGLACAKLDNPSRPVRTPDCPAGQENQAGLCYNRCNQGYDGVGAVCWGKCSGDFPFECGAGCATTELACALSITEQVVGVLDVAVTTVETVSTFGAATAVNAAIKTAMKEGIKSLVKELTKNVSKKVGKEALKKELKKEVKGLAKDSAQTLAENQADNLVNLMSGEDFDPTTLDPTGISGMVKSFIKPICGAPKGTVSTAVQKASTVIEVSQKPETSQPMREEFAKANRHGRGTGLLGTDCPAGQFFDPIDRGTCFSCPAQFKRTLLNRIDSDKACSRFVPASQETSAKWMQMPGLAIDVGMGGGSLWHIGTNPVPGGFGIYRWDGKGWVNMNGGAVRIDVDGKGNAFVANDKGEMFRHTGSGWTRLPGVAKDVGAGENGVLWHIGNNAVTGGFGIYRWNGNGWDDMKGGGVRIDVDPKGNAWIVSQDGQIWRYTGSGWTIVPGVSARDIGVGADGSVFVAAKDDGSIYKLNGSSWVKRDGILDTVTVDGKGVPFGATTAKQIWMGYP